MQVTYAPGANNPIDQRKSSLINDITTNKELDDITRQELLNQLQDPKYADTNNIFTTLPAIDAVRAQFQNALSSQDPLYLARRAVSTNRQQAASAPGLNRQTVLTAGPRISGSASGGSILTSGASPNGPIR